MQAINTNILSLMTQNNLNKSQSSLSTSIQRLSSGLRINSAKDDAAGEAISNRFTASITGLTQASRNANDGISLAQTTEGALDEINDNLQNIRRLTVQAQNGTNSESDKQSIQDEISARLDEINRISDQTEFNGVNVLKSDQDLNMQVGSDDGQTIAIHLSKIDQSTLGMDDFTVVSGIDPDSLTETTKVDVDAGYKYDLSNATDSGTATPTLTDIVKDDSGKIYVTDGTNYYEATDDGTGKLTYDDTKGTTDAPSNAQSVNGQEATTSVDATDVPDGDTLNTDGNGNYYLKDSAGNWTVATVDSAGKVTDTGTAANVGGTATTNPLDILDKALSQVDTLRSGLGAVQNRFDSVINNLDSTVNNLSESQSRIQDADFASEVSNMTRAQILQQAGESVLSQANQVPQNVLSLLQ